MKSGVPDTLQTDDEVNNLQYFLFAQAELELNGGWIFTAGASLNKSSVCKVSGTLDLLP